MGLASTGEALPGQASVVAADVMGAKYGGLAEIVTCLEGLRHASVRGPDGVHRVFKRISRYLKLPGNMPPAGQ